MAYKDDSARRNRWIKRYNRQKNYIRPTGTKQQQAQQYAADALSGKSGVYVSPRQTGLAYINANPVYTVKTNTTKTPAAQKSVAAPGYSQQEALLTRQWENNNKMRKDLSDSLVAENNREAEEKLRQAYIADMLYKRNLPQQLKAMGVSGGGTETALMNAYNTYINNRNSIEKDRLNANSKARLAYRQAIDKDYSQYLENLYKLKDKNSTAAKAKQTSGSTAKSYSASLPGTGITHTGSYRQIKSNLIKQLVAMGLPKQAARRYVDKNSLNK